MPDDLEQGGWQTLKREMRKMPSSKGLPQLAKGRARVGPRLVNYPRRHHMQVRGDGYAMPLDPGHDFILLVHRVSAQGQRRQLEAAVFEPNCRLPEYEADDLAQERPPRSRHHVARKR